MKVVIHDLGPEYESMINEKCDLAVAADGKYAPCQGCFGCWTKHPAECFMKDKLQQICRIIGRADELVIITKNLYGSYSASVKNVLDRSIGTSTPFSTYRGRQMHHTLRYGKHDLWKVIVYGEITEAEKDTFRYLAERNAINDGFARSAVVFLKDSSGDMNKSEVPKSSSGDMNKSEVLKGSSWNPQKPEMLEKLEELI